MSNIKLIIFDCDGTLIDSEHITFLSISNILTSLGYKDYTYNYCQTHLQGSSAQELREILLYLGHKDPEEILNKVNSNIRLLAEKELRTIKNVKETLNQIYLPKCIVSNNNILNVLFYLKVTKLNKFFDEKHIYTPKMGLLPKPASDLFFHAAANFKIDPQNCLVIEDSIKGMSAAYNAGMKVVGLVNKERENNSHEKFCHVLINDFKDILNHI